MPHRSHKAQRFLARFSTSMFPAEARAATYTDRIPLSLPHKAWYSRFLRNDFSLSLPLYININLDDSSLAGALNILFGCGSLVGCP
jgi:hypothetical protein